MPSSSGLDVLEKIVRLNTQTTGRDKLCRTIQYSSKLLSWILAKKNSDAELILKLKNLETSVSTTRKLLRFGKSFDLLHSTLKTIHLSDHILRLTITLSRINQACYLVIDHILWADRVGLYKSDTEKWMSISARFWLTTLILNLSRNIYDIFNILIQELSSYDKQKQRSSYKNGIGDYKSIEKPVLSMYQVYLKCIKENKPVVLDSVKNFCDLLLPLSSLGYINTSPGLQGLVGLISSILGLMVVWNPELKLVP